jgi:hypothetical protein
VYRVRRSFARFFALALVLTGLGGAVASPLGAQEEPDDAAPAFALVEQPSVVRPDDVLALRLRLTPPARADLDVRVTLHDFVETRSGFEETVAGGALGRELDTEQVSLDDLRAPDGVVTVRFAMPDATATALPVLRPGEAPGVYPLDVELLADGTTVDDFVTWLVYVPADGRAIAEPLSVVWVWSAVAPPARQADGTPDPDVLSEMQPGGRLDRISTLLGRAKGVPLTLVLSPETLQSWLDFSADHEDLRAGANAVRAAVARRGKDLLPTPYVPIDLPAFLGSGFDDYLADQLVAGRDTLRDLTGERVDPRTFFADPVDHATVTTLRNQLVERVLVRDEHLESRQSNLTPARPFALATESGDRLEAASTNPTVEEWLEGPEPAALRAQRFLAGLSLIAMEAPGAARGIVVATPERWSPDVAAVTAVLRGLRDDPLLQASTLDAYFERVEPDTAEDSDEALVRQLQPRERASQPLTVGDYEAARSSLESFRRVVGAEDAAIARGNRALLVALTSAFTPARAHEELAVIRNAASTFLNQITLTQQRVTLTARKADIPLTFSNATGQPVRVRVRLAAPSGKALFPEGAEQVVTLAPGPQTHRFLVEARATGTFAMTVTLTSEDGSLPIGAPTQITVRSTVFSGWGAMLTVGALVFLAGWWANHIWRSRRLARRAAV